MKSFLTLSIALLVSATGITANVVPRQTLPPDHFYIKAVSKDPTVNGNFAYVYGNGGPIYIRPVISNPRPWVPIVATFNSTAQTIEGGFKDHQHLWVIRDKQGATSLDIDIPSEASLDAPYSVLSDGEITSLWKIPYPYGWTTCKDLPGSDLKQLFYQKFDPECTPVRLVKSQEGPGEEIGQNEVRRYPFYFSFIF